MLYEDRKGRNSSKGKLRVLGSVFGSSDTPEVFTQLS